MLTIIDREGRQIERLSPDDMETVLAAFARPGATEQERERGAAVVSRVQQYRRWFACDCLGPGEAPPVLIPVTGSHIRRDSRRPDHADDCPFEMDPRERERYVASLRERVPREGFRLAAEFSPSRATPERSGPDRDDEGEERDPTPDGVGAGQETRRGVSKASGRDKISQLLFELLDRAHLNRVGPVPRGLGERLDALNGAAQQIPLGAGLCLRDVLETDAARLQDLTGRIGARRDWPRGRRPHGVMIFVALRIENDVLVAVSGARVTVEGPIAVFGPGRGHVRHGPFVVAVLVASPDRGAPVVPLQAYAHPCWTDDDMMPVDSTHERRCLGTLVRFQGWMARENLHVRIVKPLYDRSEYYTGREEPELVVKPDFEGTIRTPSGTFIRSFVVEVMGFNDDEYLKRKERLERIVKGKGTWWIEHPAHRGILESEGDTSLGRGLTQLGRWAARRANELRPPTATTDARSSLALEEPHRQAIERAAAAQQPATATEPATAPRSKVSIPPRVPAVQDPTPTSPPPVRAKPVVSPSASWLAEPRPIEIRAEPAVKPVQPVTRIDGGFGTPPLETPAVRRHQPPKRPSLLRRLLGLLGGQA